MVHLIDIWHDRIRGKNVYVRKDDLLLLCFNELSDETVVIQVMNQHDELIINKTVLIDDKNYTTVLDTTTTNFKEGEYHLSIFIMEKVVDHKFIIG